ncbi:uncharacterized protein LAESUDRAFT_537861 [Laetiporus sulphureus 93-53]|uniref:RING-type domain-containing protein n=1 Tax=Laetiporus sulphureus 93-53 TaxID=1314785 RepID=A0A165FK83_9APHY|nr:uncharacterized protein LAESUDRAFT_537861 [Laetiporus sulphureus 93-53]KZT09097.1 hypothetical protein LAESUDRAFT_537861 [Laetiporus sulphureus 93-53]
MGQSSSRNRTPQAPQYQDSTHAESSSGTSTPRTASAASKRSRRSSLRRSFLGLLPHASSSGSLRSDPSSNAESTQPPKKRWRSSKRWSKAPASSQLAVAELGQASSSSSGATDIHGDTPAGTRSSSPLLASASWEDSPVGASADVLSDDEQRLSQSVGAWLSGTGPPGNEERGEQADMHDTVHDLPETMYSDGDVQNANDRQGEASGTATEAGPTAEPQPEAPRQFPPPGTLVVVQGVVNTTDAPAPTSSGGSPSSRRPSRSSTPRPPSISIPTSLRRSASTSTPADGERHGTRSRLSSFMSRSRASSDLRPNHESTSNRNSVVSSDLSSSSTSHETGSAEEPSSAENHEAARAENDGRPRPLSPGSIDVLGTLLSVAAAATAASLFSPGLAFQSANGAGNGPGTTRPMSPTPTAGLGNIGGLGGLAGLGLDPLNTNTVPGATQGQRDGRDRIRNVWESLRERLGLNSRNPAFGGVNSSQGEGGNGSGEGRMRPGEMMLAEMARALNLGLGLNGEGGSASSTASDDATVVPSDSASSSDATVTPAVEAPLPPEDSFERFLINLQADLRAALSEDGAGATSQRDSVPQPASAPAHEEDQSEAGAIPTIQVEDTSPVEAGGTLSSDEQNDTDDNDLSPLATISDDSDNDDEEDEEDNMHEDDHERRLPRTPTPIPTGAFPFGGEHRQGANGDRRPPGINLWRLYRFQPIPAATLGHAASTSPTASSNSNTEAVHASAPTGAGSAPPSSTSPILQAASSESSAVPSTPTTNAHANVVVPVIVVGLQSVDMARTQDRNHSRRDSAPPADDGGTSMDPSESFEDFAQMAAGSADGQTGGAGQPRGRTWQSRAANALRTLRPGRRGGSHRRSSDTSGARTFLIYVIGGYYPPNHHMVTGSDSLDSYEALWELAELLGQVKPPVATKEDIDNSGLQIIKSSELTRYEQDGKLASNCVERCLICLDGYEAEEELRLMSCKHAFHKDCVDKWLQVGRNNCPACRTKVCLSSPAC